MFRKSYIITNTASLLFSCALAVNVTFSADSNKKTAEILPIASFLFTKLDPMLVGWYCQTDFKNQKCLHNGPTKPVGELFVQLKPRKFESEHQLALRVLSEKFKNYKKIREFNNGKELNYKQYLTIPFKYLLGAIQGEALRNIFPNDHVEFGGWIHQITYKWETPELISRSFTNYKNNIFSNENFLQGQKLKIPWEDLRSELQLKPLAVRKPLFVKKDESGLRYAFYRIKSGETLYSSVIIRFIGSKKHFIRSQNARDLLVLNGLKDAHQISKDQLIKIPLKWIKQEYIHQIPSIYLNYSDLKTKSTPNENQTPDGIDLKLRSPYISRNISQR